MDIYDNCFWFLCHSNSGVYVECEGKEGLKPVQYLSYKKGHFYRDFTFTCEACGTRISSAQERCPSCGGVYGANKEYVKKMAALHAKLLVSDAKKSLVSSANLSYHGMQGNVEMGFLIESSENKND